MAAPTLGCGHGIRTDLVLERTARAEHILEEVGIRHDRPVRRPVVAAVAKRIGTARDIVERSRIELLDPRLAASAASSWTMRAFARSPAWPRLPSDRRCRGALLSSSSSVPFNDPDFKRGPVPCGPGGDRRGCCVDMRRDRVALPAARHDLGGSACSSRCRFRQSSGRLRAGCRRARHRRRVAGA